MKSIRTIITLALVVCLLAPAASLAAAEEKPLIGIIQYVAHPALDAARDGFLDGLKELGYEDGVNITVDTRNANASPDILSSIADHFIGESATLVLAIATPAAQTLAGKTETILARHPAARILFLTTFSDDEYILRALGIAIPEDLLPYAQEMAGAN